MLKITVHLRWLLAILAITTGIVLIIAPHDRTILLVAVGLIASGLGLISP